MMKSRYRALLMPKLERKAHKYERSGIDMFGLDFYRYENLAKATPMVSSSDGLKLRISLETNAMCLARSNDI
jgi:hypothetical protein